MKQRLPRLKTLKINEDDPHSEIFENGSNSEDDSVEAAREERELDLLRKKCRLRDCHLWIQCPECLI